MNVIKLPDGSILNLALVKKFKVDGRYRSDEWRILADDDVMVGGLETRAEAEAELDTLFRDLKYR